MAAVDPAELGDAAVADLAVRIRREIDRLEGRFARLARTAHVRGLGTETGASSTAAWLARRAVIRAGDARAAIEAGEACDLLAETGRAWRSGEISTAAARTVAGARVEGHDGPLIGSEATFLDFARGDDLAGLARLAARFRNLARSDGTAPRVPDGLHISRGYAGRTVLSGDFGDLAAETVVTALHAYTEPPSEVDRRPGSQRRADALVRVSEVALDRVPAGRRHRGQVSVVVDWSTLTAGQSGPAGDQLGRGAGRSDGQPGLVDREVGRSDGQPGRVDREVGRADGRPGPAHRQPGLAGRQPGRVDREVGRSDGQRGRVDREVGRADGRPGPAHRQPGLAGGQPGRADGPHTGPIHLDDVRRLLCDTTVSRIVTGPAGIPIDVGRARRNPPARLRRALVVRDHGCRFPGCGRPPGWCDAHHVHHWTRGGPTDLQNLLLVCSYHHRLLHSPGWSTTFDGEELRIRGPDGIEVT